jgi:pimeloyl-ACP methyl ester carboxylesterase
MVFPEGPHPRLIFLPGSGADPDFWRPLGERLPAAWSKTWLGWPGLGRQPSSPAVNGWMDLVGMVEEELEDGPPADLLAQSMGGAIALMTALRRPGQVRRLVLAVTSGGIDTTAYGASNWRPGYRSEYPAAASWVEEPTPDLTTRLPSLIQPTLLLWGDADPISPVAVGRRLAELLPNAGLYVVPGGGHDIAVTHAADLADRVRTHLD